ncbi:MAG: ribose 5-phosphate isomerase B [Clostridia bacterium]|nr:ribose 5-phosphate isomerase B [Clostridia bacterium]
MIAIACDHAALETKEAVKSFLADLGVEYCDFGTYDRKSCDYPVYAAKAANAVASGECDKGILICGTGIGMSLAANKVKGIRCAACSEPFSAKMSRAHNNANMLAIGARVIGIELAKMIISEFLNTPFEGDRHQRRVDMIIKLENGEPLE